MDYLRNKKSRLDHLVDVERVRTADIAKGYRGLTYLSDDCTVCNLASAGDIDANSPLSWKHALLIFKLDCLMTAFTIYASAACVKKLEKRLPDIVECLDILRGLQVPAFKSAVDQLFARHLQLSATWKAVEPRETESFLEGALLHRPNNMAISFWICTE